MPRVNTSNRKSSTLATKAGPLGWMNARKMHKKFGPSFSVPDEASIAKIKNRSIVKIASRSQRFWVVVKSVKNNDRKDPLKWTFLGAIDNDLVGTRKYKCGDLIQFKGYHILNIHPSLAKSRYRPKCSEPDGPKASKSSGKAKKQKSKRTSTKRASSQKKRHTNGERK